MMFPSDRFQSSGYILFLILILFDVLNIIIPSFGILGVVFWFLTYCYVIIFAVECIWAMIKKSLEKKLFITLILLIVHLIILAYHIPLSKQISGETTQEIGCVLKQITNAIDGGFQQTCLFGYPSRQYFLPSLPSIVLGRTVSSLHLGGALYFILGIIIFASGILEYFDYSRKGDLIGGIILALIWHIFYVTVHLFYFEQSIFPFSFSLILCGLFLGFAKKKKTDAFYLVGIVLLYLIHSYTPSLAFYFLALIVLGIFAFRKNISKFIRSWSLVFIILTLVSFVLSLTYRADLRLIDTGEKTYANLLYDLGELADYSFYPRADLNMLFSPVSYFLFLFLIFGSLFYLFGRVYFALAIWCISVFISSVVFRGWAYYGLDFRVHKATVIFPVLFIMLICLLEKYVNNKRLLLFATLFFAFTGIQFQNRYLKLRPENNYYALLNWLGEQRKEPDSMQIEGNLSIIGDLQQKYASMGDYTAYFTPNLHHSVFNQDQNINGCSMEGTESGIFFVTIGHPCHAYLSEHSQTFRYIGNYDDQLANYTWGVFQSD